MNKKNNLLIFIAVLFVFIICSCRPQKQIIKEPIKEKGAAYLFEQLKKNEFDFSNINVKFSANVTFNKNNNSFNGNLRIKKDSIIWISVTPALGIEAMRLMINIDSAKFINRLNSTYYIGDFKYFNRLIKTDLDYDILQSILIGNDFSTYETLENNVFKASIDGKNYLLSTVGRGKIKKYLKSKDDSSKVIVQDIWIDSESYKITKIRIKDPKANQKLEAFFSDFQMVDSMLYPTKIIYNISNEKTKMEIQLENIRITRNALIEFPFNISSKYSKALE